MITKAEMERLQDTKQAIEIIENKIQEMGGFVTNVEYSILSSSFGENPKFLIEAFFSSRGEELHEYISRLEKPESLTA